MGFTVISHTILRWKHAMASPFLCCFGLSSGGGGGLKKRWDSDDGLSDLDLAASRTITCHAQVQPEVRVTSSSSSSPGTDEVGVPFAVILQKQQQSCLQDSSLSMGVNISNPAAGFLHNTAPVVEVRSLLPAQSNAASISPVSMSAPQSSTSTTYSSAHDDVEEERKNGEHRLRLLGVLPNNPFKPEFATIEARLGTFMGNNWPLDSQSGYPTAEQLAEAGLYYLGVRDSVKCFFCDGRLRRWAPHDDAWVEHARWYPDCAFVHNVKGRHFIDAVLAQERMRLSCVASTAASSSTSSSSGDEISNSITTCSQHSAESSEHAREISCNRVTPEPENSSLAEFPASNNTDQTTSSQRPSAAPPACKICLDRDVCIAFLPCGHLSACAQCAPALQHCPICRTQILSTVRTYLV